MLPEALGPLPNLSQVVEIVHTLLEGSKGDDDTFRRDEIRNAIVADEFLDIVFGVIYDLGNLGNTQHGVH
jgi:hypothetical protein